MSDTNPRTRDETAISRRRVLSAVAGATTLAGCTGSTPSTSEESPTVVSFRGEESGSLCAATVEVDTGDLQEDERVVIEANGISSIFNANDESGPVRLERIERGTEVIAYRVNLRDKSVSIERWATVAENCSLTEGK